MNIKRTWLALAALSLAMVTPSRADVFFDNYCVSGAFPVCASVRVAASGNVLTLQVWNLEDVLGGTGLGTPHTITAIGLYHVGPSWGSVLGHSVNYVTDGGSTPITGAWSEPASDIATLGGVSLDVSVGTPGETDGTGNSGITGCTPMPGSGVKWSTCGSFPGKPYVEFKFIMSEDDLALGDVELRWHSQQVGPDQEESLKCDTGGAGDYPPCTGVPEPVTVALLGGGLAGLGGVGFIRRRRRKGLDVEGG